MSAPRRGEVWLVNFDPIQGHEQAGVRPALVLSVDAFNAAAGLVTVLPITSKPRALRTRVEVSPPEAGLKKVSYVIGEQVRTISTARLAKRMGLASEATMEAATAIVKMLLGM
jgi:mRNA interferase MazF